MTSFELSSSTLESTSEQSDARPEHSFAGLIDPVPPSEFLDRYWGKSHVFIHRHDPSYFKDLYSLEDVDRSMLGAKAHSDQLLTIIAPPGSGRVSTRRRVGEVSADKLYSAFSGGDSLRLMRLEEYWAPIAELAASVREFFDAAVSVGFYMTPPHSQAFPIHFDSQDNFIVQVDGWKEWFIYEDEFPYPLDSGKIPGANAKATHLDEGTARPREKARLVQGDVLYIPRGFYHKAVTSSSTSLHLTISVMPSTWVDFLKRAIDLLCADQVDLRKSLPPGYARDPESRSGMDGMFRSLLRLVADKASFDDALRSLLEDEVAGRTCPADGHFGALSRIHALAPSSWMETRPGLVCLVERIGESIAVCFGRNRVQGPLAIAPALEFVRDHKRFRISDLPGGLSAQSQVVLAARLVREGLLRPVQA